MNNKSTLQDLKEASPDSRPNLDRSSAEYTHVSDLKPGEKWQALFNSENHGGTNTAMSSCSQTPKKTAIENEVKITASLKTSLDKILKPTVVGRSAPLGTIIVENKTLG